MILGALTFSLTSVMSPRKNTLTWGREVAHSRLEEHVGVDGIGVGGCSTK